MFIDLWVWFCACELKFFPHVIFVSNANNRNFAKTLKIYKYEI